MRFLAVLLIAGVLQAAPRLVFKEIEFDFGEAFEQDSVIHVFSFYNKGDDTLIIRKVKSSCGCTAALLSNNVIPPGDSGEIKTIFRTGRYRGKITKVVHVYSNDPRREVVTLTITGKVKKILELEPPRINFGLLRWGEDAEADVKIFPAIEGVKIEVDSVRGRGLETSLKRYSEKGKKGYIARVKLHVSNKLESGFHYIPLLIYLEKPKKLRVEVPVTFRVRSRIEVFPRVLTFGTIPKDTIVTSPIYIKNNAETPIHITDVVSSDSQVKVNVKAEKEGFNYTIYVTVEPAPYTSFIKTEILIKTDDRENPEIRVPVYALIK